MNKYYIAGFFDGEGYITNFPKIHKIIHITNTNLEILDEMSKYLKKIGIENYIRIHNKYDKNLKHNACYRLFITGYKNIKLFGDEINFHSRKQKDKYKILMDLYQKNSWRRNSPVK